MSKSVTRGATLARHYEVMTWVLRKRGAWTAKIMSEELQLGIRSAYRYLNALKEAGVVWEVGRIDLSNPWVTLWRSRYSMMLRSDVQQKDDVLQINQRPGCVMRVAAPTVPCGPVVVRRALQSKQQKR